MVLVCDLCLCLQGFKICLRISFMACWGFLRFKSLLVLLFLMSEQHELWAKSVKTAFTHLTVVSCVSTVQHWESSSIHVKMTSCASVQQKKTKFLTSTLQFTWKTRSRSGRWMRFSASSGTLYPFCCISVLWTSDNNLVKTKVTFSGLSVIVAAQNPVVSLTPPCSIFQSNYLKIWRRRRLRKCRR